jgi:hypothetical protein
MAITSGTVSASSSRHLVSAHHESRGILVVCLGTGWQLNPRVPAAVIDGYSGRRKVWICKRAYGNAYGVITPFLSVENRGSADWAEPEPEPRSLISGADVFGGHAGNFERRCEPRESCEHTSGASLAGETVTNADASRFTLDLHAKLSTSTAGRSGGHESPRLHEPTTSSGRDG